MDTLSDVAGAQAVIEWFGRFPLFHDAHLNEIVLSSKGPSWLRIATWNITDKIDDKGYFILEKHAVVVITLHDITSANLGNFNFPGIILSMRISRTGG